MPNICPVTALPKPPLKHEECVPLLYLYSLARWETRNLTHAVCVSLLLRSLQPKGVAWRACVLQP